MRHDHQGVALLEAKGSRKANSRRFDNRVADGYLDQVEPHLGFNVGNAIATHGYCVGSWMQSPTKAELFVHATETVAVASGAQPEGTPSQIIRGNYVAALRLAHSEALATQFREGGRGEFVPFLQFEWLEEEWLTSWLVHADDKFAQRVHFLDLDSTEGPFYWRWWDRSRSPTTFAIEKERALTVLGSYPTDHAELLIEPMPQRVRGRAREEIWSAVFPDGLAVVSSASRIKNVHLVYLDETGHLRDDASHQR